MARPHLNKRDSCTQSACLGPVMSKSKAVVTVIPSGWRQIVQRKKTVLGWPDWSAVAALPTGRNVRPRRNDVHTVSAEITEAVFQLADERGTGLEGVRLRLKAWAYRRHRDVTGTLEVVGGRTFVTISRIDAWPSDPHHNSFKALRKRGLKGFPGQIPGCHVHRFDDNVKYGAEAFGAGPEGNLPVAAAFPNDLESLRDFLRSVRAEFNIDGLDEFPGPPSWQGLV
jgi:hypothetical protein